MPRCSRFGFELNKPCSMCKCKYHINRDVYNNCLDNVLMEKGDFPLKISEIAFLMSKPKAFIESEINKALDSIKISKLDKTIDVGNEIEFVENSHRCVVWSNQADISVSDKLPNLHYCSEKCKKIMPPKLVYLVNKLGVDARTILLAGVRCLSGVSFKELLEVSENEFKFLFKYYFGINLVKIVNETVEPDLEYGDFKYHYYKLPNLKSFIYADDELVKNNVISCFCWFFTKFLV